MNEKRKLSRTLVGKVISNSMNKTIVVQVERKIQDAIYGKYLRRSTKLHAHDNETESRMGDVVLIKECRPISKTKSWELVQVLEKADVEDRKI